MSEEPKSGVPTWIVSYTGMFTLLLSFFVVLQTMAKSQDAALLGISQESFKRAIAGLGIPDFLFGDRSRLDDQYRKLKYPTEESEEAEHGRVIDADDERIRQLFEDIRKEDPADTTNKARGKLSLIRVPVHFAKSKAALDERALQLLGETVRDLLSAGEGKKTVAVVAIAVDESTPRGKAIVSALRANAVEQYLVQALSRPGRGKWEVVSWGAAGGSAALQAVGFDGKSGSILLAVSATGE